MKYEGDDKIEMRCEYAGLIGRSTGRISPYGGLLIKSSNTDEYELCALFSVFYFHFGAGSGVRLLDLVRPGRPN